MMLRLTGSLALLLLTACASHVGRPPAPLPVPAVLPFETLRERFTPPGRPPLYAEVQIPRGEGPFPAVLLIHGGGWIGGEPADMASLADALARQGFVTVNMAYRLAPEHRHPAQVEDVATALAWMRAEADRLQLEPARIGLWGYSAGAHLAALVSGRLPAAERPQAVVAGGLPADLRRYPRSPLIAKLMGTARDADPTGWADASPLHHVDAQMPPTFLYHGSWDWVVGAVNAREMKAALDAQGVRNELYLIHGYGHFAAFLWHRGSERAATDFLRRHL
jgi:acetyl esterase/lipase